MKKRRAMKGTKRNEAETNLSNGDDVLQTDRQFRVVVLCVAVEI